MKKRQLWVISGLLVFSVGLYVSRKMILYFLAAFLVVQDPIKPSDAIFVLSGEFPSRILEAASLYKEKFGKFILLSQDKEEPAFKIVRNFGIGSDIAPTRNELNQNILRALQVPKENIRIMSSISERTIQEAYHLLSEIQKIGNINSVIVVTSATHTRRARKLMVQAFKNSPTKIQIRASRYDPLDLKNWWNDSLQRRGVGHEWLAMLVSPILGMN